MLCLQIKLECNSLDRLLTCESKQPISCQSSKFPPLLLDEQSCVSKVKLLPTSIPQSFPSSTHAVIIFTAIYYQPHVQLQIYNYM